MTLRRALATAAAVSSLCLPLAVLAADVPNDSFIAGYAAAVLERELSVRPDGLTVTNGVVRFSSAALSPDDRVQAIKVLLTIPGVKSVTIDGETAEPLKSPVPLSPPLKVTTPTTAPADSSSADSSSTNGAAAGVKVESPGAWPLSLYLGAGRTFAPLQADPRWPHLFASYHNYMRDLNKSTDLNDVASVGFGETISLLRQTSASDFRWELGVQGGLFAIFDTGTDSKDLINADYMVGPYVAMRQGNWSFLGRVYHQSSHVGDEYLLRGGADPRVNYSFEQVNLLASYDLPYGFRVYAGGSYKFDLDPEGFDPWAVQYGAEWTSPTTIPGLAWVRPVAALDVQNAEENGWATSLSLRAGVQFEDPARYTQRLQLMFEFYDGNSPNGQFYADHIQYYGFGFHFYF